MIVRTKNDRILDIPASLFRVQRYVILKVTSCAILAEDPIDAITQFDNGIDYYNLVANAAGQGELVTNIEWAEENDGAQVELVDEKTLTVSETTAYPEEFIDDLTERILV
jgi:hypothetical protein